MIDGHRVNCASRIRRIIWAAIFFTAALFVVVFFGQRNLVRHRLEQAGFTVEYSPPSLAAYCPRWATGFVTAVVRRTFPIAEVSGRGLTVTIHDMSDISKCDDLSEVDFENMRLPPGWSTYLPESGRLKILCLSRTDCVSKDITEIARQSHLTDFICMNCGFTDRDMMIITNFQSLANLDVSWNAITDAGLLSLTNMLQLRRLRLAGTDIDGASLERLSYLTNLVALDLANTSVFGGGISNISRLKSLESLTLSHTVVNEQVMSAVSNLRYLADLDISDCNVKEDDLLLLEKLASLRNLHLEGNGIDGTRLSDLGKRLPKCTIYK